MAVMDPKPCLYCSGIFVPAKKTTLFCSRSCQAKWLRQENVLKNKQRKGVYKDCAVCGTNFYVPAYRANTALYCSRRCTSIGNPENTQKARDKSPIMARKGSLETKKYKTVMVNGKQVREHRFVMEQHIGRKLESWEHVHHIDGNHLNNDINNLQILSNSEHQKLELAQWAITKPDS